MSEKNSTDTLRTRVLETIEHQNLVPQSALHFLMREWVVRTIAVLALFLGSIATALSIYIAGTSRFMERQIQFSSLETLFELIPFFWLLLLMVGVYYTVQAIRGTKHGYRYHPAWLVGGALAASILLGYGTHAAGLGETIDDYLLTEVPLYKPLTAFKPAQWMHPDAGVLAGIVEEVDGNTITLRTLEGEVHTVVFGSSTTAYLPQQPHTGMPLRVVGTTSTSNKETVFSAETMGPFLGRGGRMHGQGKGVGWKRKGLMKENSLPGRSNK